MARPLCWLECVDTLTWTEVLIFETLCGGVPRVGLLFFASAALGGPEERD
jgi:hypothetical protein